MLKELARMSQGAGARVDYTQGGGGNTSVKLGDGFMAIKASGLRLSDVTETDGFAMVELRTLKDVTTEKGYKPLRPSVEVGFHALLGRFVLHTHAAYANLALCSKGGTDRLPALMEGYDYLIVPYINPGEELSRYIKEHMRPTTQVVFLTNHGIVVSADTADEALRIHDDVNERIAKSFGVTKADFDKVAAFTATVLYPDQQVYLTLTDAQQDIMAAVTFIHTTLLRNGMEPQGMDEKAMDFIEGWESEAYRKTILK